MQGDYIYCITKPGSQITPRSYNMIPRLLFNQDSDTIVTLFIADGHHILEYNNEDDCIDFSNIEPGK